jgi:hypothetical protein
VISATEPEKGSRIGDLNLFGIQPNQPANWQEDFLALFLEGRRDESLTEVFDGR